MISDEIRGETLIFTCMISSFLVHKVISSASRQEERRNLPTRDHGTSAKLNELVTELNLFQLWGKQLKGLLKEVMDADDLNMMS